MFLCWVIFLFLICRTFKHCSSPLEQTPDLSASICLLLFKASPIFHNQNIEYYGLGPTASFGMSLNLWRFVGFIILFFFPEHVYFTYNNIIRLHFAHIFKENISYFVAGENYAGIIIWEGRLKTSRHLKVNIKSKLTIFIFIMHVSDLIVIYSVVRLIPKVKNNMSLQFLIIM